jgi:uroporphyrinogen III methyltransferase/synthase
MANPQQTTRSLDGLRVLVTRPQAQAASLVRLLGDEGATPVEAPLISIRPCLDYDGAIRQALLSLDDYHWLVFTSVNGVEVFFDWLLALGLDEKDLHGLSVAAIGPATSQSLKQRGIEVALMPHEHRTAGIVKAMSSLDLQGKRVLLPRAEEGSAELPPSLEALGAEVKHISLYRTEIPHNAGIQVHEALRGGLDVATFTSPSAVRSMVSVLEGRMEQLAPVVLACIGPVTAEEARHKGLEIDVVASEHTSEGLVQALKEHYTHGRT